MYAVVTWIVYLLSIGFAVYGLYVFWRWHKVALKMDEILDEMRDEMEEINNV